MLPEIKPYRPLNPRDPQDTGRSTTHRKVGKTADCPLSKRTVNDYEQAEREPKGEVDRYA